MMKKLFVFALVLAAFAPALAAQTAASFTGKWEGTFTLQNPDGTAGNSNKVVFNLIQKGKVLTGTGGPTAQQMPVDKGVVNAGKATFEIQEPNGPLFKFTLSIVKGHLLGDMTGEQGGVVRGKARIDAVKTPAK